MPSTRRIRHPQSPHSMSTPVPRYLVPFHPKRVPHFFTDVLVIGGGLAGLRAALAVDPKLSVVVIAKQGIEESNSNYAQGGVAAVIGSRRPLRGPRGRHARGRRLAVRSRGGRASRGRGPAADPRTDRLGHAVRPQRQAAWRWAARAGTATTASSTPWATPPARKSCA